VESGKRWVSTEVASSLMGFSLEVEADMAGEIFVAATGSSSLMGDSADKRLLDA